MEKTQVVAIHGGDTFSSMEEFVENLKNKKVDIDRMRPKKGWRSGLQKELGEDFDVLLPRMPLSDNADYEIWKMWFEKIINVVDDELILVGHSLGAMFLIKYLTENKIDKKIKSLLLASPAYCGIDKKDECCSFNMTKKTSFFEKNMKNIKKITFFHSKDDSVVLYENFLKFKEVVTNADFVSFSDKGHFLDEKFPEIVNAIKETR